MNRESDNPKPPAPTGAGQGDKKGEALPPPLASTEAQGSGGQAPQQAAKPSDSDGGNAHGSGHYGSLPPLRDTAVPTDEELTASISIKLFQGDLDWLDREAAVMGKSRSALIRIAIKTLRYRHPLQVITLRPRWGGRAGFKLRECKDLYHHAHLLIRSIKGEAAYLDDRQTRMLAENTVRHAEKLAWGLDELLRLLGGLTPEQIRKAAGLYHTCDIVADDYKAAPHIREGARIIAEGLKIMGFAEHWQTPPRTS